MKWREHASPLTTLPSHLTPLFFQLRASACDTAVERVERPVQRQLSLEVAVRKRLAARGQEQDARVKGFGPGEQLNL